MPRSGPVFQEHHAIEQQTLERSPLLKALSDAGHFDIHAPENRIFLPADPVFAQALGVTPHSGGPLSDYQIGLRLHMWRLEQSPDGMKALSGDPDALGRIAGRVETLRDTVRVGLINGDLHTNAPLGLRADDIRPSVQNFFRNEVAYGQANAAQLQGLKGYAPVDHGWAAVTHTEGRVVSTLPHIQSVPNPLTLGGAVELQRHGLSQAISNAYHSGRLTMSPSGVAVVESTLGKEAAHNLRVPRGQRGEVAMQLLMGEASARGLTRAGGLPPSSRWARRPRRRTRSTCRPRPATRRVWTIRTGSAIRPPRPGSARSNGAKAAGKVLPVLCLLRQAMVALDSAASIRRT